MKREAQSGIFINECASPPILGSKLFLLLFYKTIIFFLKKTFPKKDSPRDGDIFCSLPSPAETTGPKL